MQILVTGGAGYIGSHMVGMLLDAGHRVTVLDNLSRGHADATGAAPLVIGDLRSREDLRACFGRTRFDLVMHFAGLAYVGESVEEPAAYYGNNVVGTLHLLETMHEHGVRRFIFSSSCATYGEVGREKVVESQVQQPLNPYGHSKLLVEQALRDYAGAYGLQSISLRYFNAAGCDSAGRFGERHEPETHLIPLVLREAMRVLQGGDPAETSLQVFGTDFDTPDGTCVRDFVHVSDICSAHLLAAERLMVSSGPAAEAYNLGSSEGHTVLQVIESCRRVTGVDIRFRRTSRRPGDAPYLVADAEAARRILGWNPVINGLDRIIQSAWAWMTAHTAIPR